MPLFVASRPFIGVGLGQQINQTTHTNVPAFPAFNLIGLVPVFTQTTVAQAELVNQYLSPGNTVSLGSLFRGFLAQTMAGTSQWGNRQFYDKIVAIRTYNQTRPNSLQIRFLGGRLVFGQRPLHA
jgi:hypothetical protein